jgi:N-carbamoyl-L-amino-acid hydrolase
MNKRYKTLKINGARLMDRLMAMAKIGETPKGGVCRVALTDEDKAGRDLFVKWCQEAGCAITIDKVGNIFAHRSGKDNKLSPVLAGSHLDSQPTGGKFDGVYGVLAALEAIETLNDGQITTLRPVEVVSWTNEEGARFAPGLTGSGTYAGIFDLKYTLTREDKQGRSVGEELQRIGYVGDAPVGGRSIRAAFEAHIEQGPILEMEGKTIGIVTGVQGMRWYDIIFEGQEAHAGTTPMETRRDPVKGALRVMQRIYPLAEGQSPEARATFGEIRVEPGTVNTVPGRLTVTLDLRHPDSYVLDALDQEIRSIVESECKVMGLTGRVDEIWHMPPVSFAPECVEAVSRAADTLGLSSMEITSGAGHDALYLSQITPTGMIFVPCENGLSHNELENTKPEDLNAGANVLLHAILDLANA